MRRMSLRTAAVLLALGASTSGCAGTTALPSEKARLESFAAAWQSSGPRADKSSDPGRPLVVQTDPPPAVGLFEHVGAPAPGGVFTPTNAWAGWIDAKTFVQVWAGDRPDSGGGGLIMVMRRPGVGDGVHLDPDAESVVAFVPPPTKGGPLRISAVREDGLVIRNAEGKEFLFDPARGAFVTP